RRRVLVRSGKRRALVERRRLPPGLTARHGEHDRGRADGRAGGFPRVAEGGERPARADCRITWGASAPAADQTLFLGRSIMVIKRLTAVALTLLVAVATARASEFD